MLATASSAGVDIWRWEPHPEIWLLVAGLAVLWWHAVHRIGPIANRVGEPILTRSQLVWGVAGLLTLWFATDWPVHDLGERHLYSVHMLQHLLLTFAVAPMALLATPAWLARLLVGHGPAYRTVRRLSRLLPATMLFNAVVVLSHWPSVVNHVVDAPGLHYGVHLLAFLAALVMWLPVCGPLPELRFSLPVQMGHLFLQSIVPTVPASFLTLGDSVLYKTYDHAGRVWGMTAVQDQQLAGALMKVGGGAFLWSVIFILFVRFAAVAESDDRANGTTPDRRAPQLTWEQVERELAEAPPAPKEPVPPSS